MYALVFEELVVQVAAETFEVAPTLQWVECPDECVPGWTYIGGILLPPAIPQPTPGEIINSYSQAIQEFMDGVAMQKSYQSSIHCATYANSTIPQWKAQAEAFIAWRDTVWLYVYTELPKFESGQRPLIPVDQFIAEFPPMVWPS